MYSKAYQVACLGVTDSDWRALAEAAIQSLDLDISRKAFIRIKDLMFLKLIKSLESRRKNENEYALLGDIYAYLGKFNLAANAFQKANVEGKALMMYIDLRMFDKAQMHILSVEFSLFCSGILVYIRRSRKKKALVLKKAEWAKSINELKASAEMYLSVGETQKAVELAAENDWSEMLITISKKVDLTEPKTLSLIGQHLKRLHEYGAAAEIFHKVGDIPSLVEMNVEAKNWKEAFELAKQYPTYKENVYVPYANWLAENDRFVEAQKEEPFTMQHTETLFNMSRYLWLELVKIDFPGISKFRIFYAAAKQSCAMKAFKLARMAYQQANIYRIPERFRESVEIATMHIHAKTFTDSEDSVLIPEILPVVEFFLEEGIDDDEAYKLLARKPKIESNTNTVMMDYSGNDTQYLKIEDNDPFEEDSDIFTYDSLILFMSSGIEGLSYCAISATADLT
ncbi:intraflagellar transport protein 122 homolog [Caerostris extrusa]|uniref:Intraflagellar transport protein 122 homolog n=1 Tax=Caerostris extrusa TaxID=172846 RepID=A0AAV4NQD5_CAEEX|nr:intraflagellar transport protein 122 homolog [Caerostris extrusa]